MLSSIILMGSEQVKQWLKENLEKKKHEHIKPKYIAVIEYQTDIEAPLVPKALPSRKLDDLTK